jgi:hypothetical protein
VVTPAINPSGGTFTNAQTIAITTATSGSEIRYTLDGTEPSATSTLYSSSFSLTNSATISAKAFKVGMTASATARAVFNITVPIVPPTGTNKTAKFLPVPVDFTTQGNWKPGYGSDGYTLIGDVAKVPAYAQMSTVNASPWLWNGRTGDARALITPDGTYRSAGCWYSPTTFTIDLNFIDGRTHRFGMYCLDWDFAGRSELIELLDADSGAVMQSTTVSTFTGGEYLAWDISGHVKVRVTRITGANAVVSGVFFAPSAITL